MSQNKARTSNASIDVSIDVSIDATYKSSRGFSSRRENCKQLVKNYRKHIYKKVALPGRPITR